MLLNETKSKARVPLMNVSFPNSVDWRLLFQSLLRQKSYEALHELSYNRAGGKTPGENHADYLPSKR